MRHLTPLIAMLLAVAPNEANASDLQTLSTADGTQLEYLLLLPERYDPAKAYPTVLALPPGAQDRAMVDAVVRPWRDGWYTGGWIVVSPVAPTGQSFYGQAAALLPELMDHVAAHHTVAGAKYYLFGVSNGGRGAFQIGLDHPERFVSMVVIPGVPVGDGWDRLDRLKPVTVTLVVGSEDGGWTSSSRRAAEALRAAGADVELLVVEGQGHAVFQTVSYETLEGWLTR